MSGENMIPKLIHHLWIDPVGPSQTHLTIPADVQENLLSWRTIEATYQQKIWLLDEILALCSTKNLPSIAEAILACRFPSMQADIARLLLLHIFGGFWADLKLRLNVRFIDRLADYDLILTEHFPKIELPEPNGRLLNSFIGAVPGNPVITKALEYVMSNVNSRLPGSIYHVTGATNLENSIREVTDHGAYLMLPHKTAWDYLFTICAGSYNGSDMHWSLREQREHPYHNQFESFT